MNYTEQCTRLMDMLEFTNNPNLVRDFFIQLQEVLSLDKDMISYALDSKTHTPPSWIDQVTKTDIRNIVLFLMWKEFRTVIDAMESVYNEESSLGTNIESLYTYLETKYYVNQISSLMRDKKTQPILFTEWVKDMVDKKGIPHTIEQLMP